MSLNIQSFLILILSCISLTVFAETKIHLKDTQCMILGSNFIEVKYTEGSLIDAICLNDDKKVFCSYTSRKGTMAGGKPSNITQYMQLYKDSESAIWVAPTGTYILDFNKKRYSFAGTYIMQQGLFNKNCVGDIKEN